MSAAVSQMTTELAPISANISVNSADLIDVLWYDIFKDASFSPHDFMPTTPSPESWRRLLEVDSVTKEMFHVVNALETRSRIVQVCRRWHRVALPLLYHTFNGSRYDFQGAQIIPIFLRTVDSHPDRREHVRRIYSPSWSMTSRLFPISRLQFLEIQLHISELRDLLAILAGSETLQILRLFIREVAEENLPINQPGIEGQIFVLPSLHTLYLEPRAELDLGFLGQELSVPALINLSYNRTAPHRPIESFPISNWLSSVEALRLDIRPGSALTRVLSNPLPSLKHLILAPILRFSDYSNLDATREGLEAAIFHSLETFTFYGFQGGPNYASVVATDWTFVNTPVEAERLFQVLLEKSRFPSLHTIIVPGDIGFHTNRYTFDHGVEYLTKKKVEAGLVNVTMLLNRNGKVVPFDGALWKPYVRT